MKDALRKQLVRAHLRHLVVLGGIDFSFNEDSQERWTPHWQPHWQLAVEGCSSEEFIKALKAWYSKDPKDKACPKPIYTDEIDNPIEQLSYLVKPFFERRVSYTDKDGKSDAKDWPLKPKQLREIAVFMDRFDMTDRLFMQNVRRYGPKLVRQKKTKSTK